MYEYNVVEVKDIAPIMQIQQFNEIGKDDWELICVTEKFAYFVRYVAPFKSVDCEEEVKTVDLDAFNKMVYSEYEYTID